VEVGLAEVWSQVQMILPPSVPAVMLNNKCEVFWIGHSVFALILRVFESQDKTVSISRQARRSARYSARSVLASFE
jgi:hypothetical protein